MIVKKYNLLIVIPVFNDWDSFEMLLSNLSDTFQGMKENILVLAVNDGSTQRPVFNLQSGLKVEILNLVRNVGHQKAITIGLCYGVLDLNADYIIVMDSDGEDQPEDASRLFKSVSESSESIVFASRTKRMEGPFFKIMYSMYKRLFKILTGFPISFGNFCAMPNGLAKKIIYVSEIWNHFSGGIMRSKLPYKLLPTKKGNRYKGFSKMNFQSLILHGLSSISVHIDLVAVRFLISSIVLLLFSIVAIAVVINVKLFTTLALPGWTSTMIIGLTLVFLQALLFSVLLTFIILSYRTQKTFIPATDYKQYIQNSPST
jgi:glycosyltransferase involved in cell wall biosynthesis